MAVFLAATPLAFGAGEQDAKTVVNPVSSPAWPGVGMPDTGPGTRPVKPLTDLVDVGPVYSPAMRNEIENLAFWLGDHHGRARITVLKGRHATRLAEASAISRTKFVRSVSSRRAFIQQTFAGRKGKRLLLNLTNNPIGGSRKFALLTLPTELGAQVAARVPLTERGQIEQPIDMRRSGVLAATAARGVISLTNLNGLEKDTP